MGNKIDDLFGAFGSKPKKAKVKSKAKPLLSEAEQKRRKNSLYMDGVSYMSMKKEAGVRAKQMGELHKSILSRVEEEGVDIDDKHKALQIGIVKFNITYRENSCMDDEAAEKVLKKKGLLSQATITVIDYEKVLDLYRQKKLTKADIEEIVTLKRSPVLSVNTEKEKEEETDGEE